MKQLEDMMRRVSEEVSEEVSERVSRKVSTEVFQMGFEQLIKPEFKEIREHLTVVDDRLDNIETTMDAIANDYTALRQEETIGAHTQSQHRDRLDDHEKRIVKIEGRQLAAT